MNGSPKVGKTDTPNASVQGKEDDLMPRDAYLVDDNDNDEYDNDDDQGRDLLLWAPYVHFGV